MLVCIGAVGQVVTWAVLNAADGTVLNSDAVVITTGTFLRGEIHIGTVWHTPLVWQDLVENFLHDTHRAQDHAGGAVWGCAGHQARRHTAQNRVPRLQAQDGCVWAGDWVQDSG